MGKTVLYEYSRVQVLSDYIMKIKNNLKFVFNNFFIPYYWLFNFIISLFFLWMSPLELICWLIFFTIIYSKYCNQLTLISFVKIWLPVIILWYLILMIGMKDYLPIIIGPGYTNKFMLNYLYNNGTFINQICFSTVLTLHILSSLLGFPIVIPVIF